MKHKPVILLTLVFVLLLCVAAAIHIRTHNDAIRSSSTLPIPPAPALQPTTQIPPALEPEIETKPVIHESSSTNVLDASTTELINIATSTRRLTWDQVKQLINACQIRYLNEIGKFLLLNGRSGFFPSPGPIAIKTAVDQASERCKFSPSIGRHTGGDQ